MNRILSVGLLLLSFLLVGQTHTSEIKKAIEENDLKALQKLCKKDKNNPAWTDCTFFQQATAVDNQPLMKFLMAFNPACDAVWMNDLVYNYWKAGRTEETEFWGPIAMKNAANLLGVSHEEYGFAASTLGVHFNKTKQWEEAEKYLLIAYEVFKVAKGVNHDWTETGRDNLIRLYENYGVGGQTEQLLKESIEYHTSASGYESKERIAALDRLISFYSTQGDFQKAHDNTYLKLLLYEGMFGKDHKETIWVLGDYLHYSKKLGMFWDITEDGEERYLPLVAEYWGSESLTYADAVAMMAEAYYQQGNYSKAESYYLMAMPKISQQIDINYIYGLIRMTQIYHALGRKQEREQYFDLLLKTLDAFESANVVDKAAVNMVAANTLMKQKRYDKAEELLNKSLQSMIDHKETKHTIYSGIINNLGHIALNRKKPEEALKYYRNYRNQENLYGRLLTYSHYENTGKAFMQLLQFDSAHFYFKTANSIYLKDNSTITSNYYELTKHSAMSEWALGNRQVAMNMLGFGNYNSLRSINKEFFQLSEMERKQFWEQNQPAFQLYQRLVTEHAKENPAITGDSYNLQLQTKGLLLNTSDFIQRAILKSTDQSLKSDFREWINLKKQLARYANFSQEQLARDSVDLEKVETLANQLEKSISQRSSAFADASAVPDWKEIKASLKANEAAIEIIRTRDLDASFSLTDDPFYFGLVVRADAEFPKLVSFQNPSDMEGVGLKYYRNAIQYKLNDAQSYDRYWAPLEKSLEGISKIYFSADGVYNLINLNTLKDPESQTYVLDRYNIHLVTNTRDLLQAASTTKPSKNAVLAGFPTYDFNPSTYSQVTSGLTNASKRSVYANTSEWLSGAEISVLPGTQNEVTELNRLLTKQGWITALHVGGQATEETIRAIQNPRVLHIATHGFFIANEENFTEESTASDPMLRSGLLLAGVTNFANANPKPQTEDGILTAFETTTMELDGTELVVLSACETGLGEVQNGEGVYGLQRGLKSAGAKSILMSLWKVDDQTTLDLMLLFYQNWIGGDSKPIAFQKAQKAVRTNHPEPYYWGAFQLVGE